MKLNDAQREWLKQAQLKAARQSATNFIAPIFDHVYTIILELDKLGEK